MKDNSKSWQLKKPLRKEKTSLNFNEPKLNWINNHYKWL